MPCKDRFVQYLDFVQISLASRSETAHIWKVSASGQAENNGMAGCYEYSHIPIGLVCCSVRISFARERDIRTENSANSSLLSSSVSRCS